MSRSGVARSTLYRHWNNKSELILEGLESRVIERLDPEVARIQEAAAASEYHSDIDSSIISRAITRGEIPSDIDPKHTDLLFSAPIFYRHLFSRQTTDAKWITAHIYKTVALRRPAHTNTESMNPLRNGEQERPVDQPDRPAPERLFVKTRQVRLLATYSPTCADDRRNAITGATSHATARCY